MFKKAMGTVWKHTSLVGDPVTFLFVGCKSLSGPFTKSVLLIFSSGTGTQYTKNVCFLTWLL